MKRVIAYVVRGVVIVSIIAVPMAATGAQSAAAVMATTDSTPAVTAPVAPQTAQKKTPWYDKISLRGYAQIRYNRLLETNKDYNCAQCDKSIGDNGGIFLRRARLVLSGDVSDRVSIYIQPDYATDAAGALHYLQIRDAYFDLWLDGKKEHRLRIGQSKIPFGFENLQSSSNRLPLDRNDGLNSGMPNERDLAAIYYWAPTAVRRNLKILTDSGLKGSGDYGLVGIGVFNGQTANRPEANNSLHTVARVTYPFRLSNGQFVEVGVSGYSGRFVVPTRTTGIPADPEYKDERVALSFLMYAQPLGLEAEWNWGNGPEYDLDARRITTQPLNGGFVQAMYRWQTQGQVVQPFVRWQYYNGGKKMELDARRYDVQEVEGGVEWLPSSAFELTVDYVRGRRVTADGRATQFNRQDGGFMRIQAQINY